jgi:hypothetical protein
MKVRDVIERLGCEVVSINDGVYERRIASVVVSDLMSDVLVTDEVDLLVTSLAGSQTLRTADIVGAHTVLLVNDKPAEDLKGTAEDLGITLLRTKGATFEVSGALYNLRGAK